MNYKKELYGLLSELCFDLGLNTAHDYEGIESDEDVAIYSNAIKRQIEALKNRKLKSIKEELKVEKFYDNKGNATHYDQNRMNAIIKYERTYGTLAVMTFCEITADRYRERIGKKDNQAIEQEVLKIGWYERAANWYFNKLGTEEEIIVNNSIKYPLEWEEK